MVISNAEKEALKAMVQHPGWRVLIKIANRRRDVQTKNIFQADSFKEVLVNRSKIQGVEELLKLIQHETKISLDFFR